MNSRTVRNIVLIAILLTYLALALPIQAQDGTRLEQGVTFLEANQIPPESYIELSAALSTNDYHEISAVLVKYGYTPDQLKAFVTEPNLLLLRSVINPGPTDALLSQASAILASYHLTAADLQALAPLVNDPVALMTALLEKGLTEAQVIELLQQIAPLIQEITGSGLMQYIAMNGQIQTLMTQAGLPISMLFESAPLLRDSEAVTAYLAQLGYTEQEIQTFVGLLPTLIDQGVIPSVVMGWNVRTMIYRLEGIGLSPQTIYEIVALGNIDAVRGYLVAQGFSGSALELALIHIGGCMGFHAEELNSERLEGFQAREANGLLNSVGLDPAAMADILPLSSDPTALSDVLRNTYGLDEPQIAAFVTRLGQSTFVQTVDPANVADFVTSIIAYAE